MSYSAWAKRKRLYYAFGAFLLFLGILIPFIIPFFIENPTCFDGKQNQGETAIDMGGPCIRLDPRTLDNLQVLWVRPTKIRDGVYNAVAYVKNPNLIAATKNLPFKISLYNSRGALIAEKIETTDVYPGRVFPVFVSDLNTGYEKASIATLRFLKNKEQLIWFKKVQDLSDFIGIKNKQIKLTPRSTFLDIKVQNTSIEDLSDIYFTAVLFDENGNAILSARNYEPYILSGQSKTLRFSWPVRFKASSFDVTALVEFDYPEELKAYAK